MAHSEIDSFVMKFKQIMHSGKKVDLNIKSEAGKAVINLTVEVDVPLQPQRSAQPRNGPARQRRREKRAAARDAAEQTALAEEAAKNVPNPASEKDEVIVVKKVDPNLHVTETDKMVAKETTTAEEVTNRKENSNSKVHVAGKAAFPLSEVQDEFCPNKSFENKSTNTLSYSEAVAPIRKLGGFDYYSLKYDSDSE